MKTMTFVFVEPGHIQSSIVTAETEEECAEKYFLKYPERRELIGTDQLAVLQGEVAMNWRLKRR